MGGRPRTKIPRGPTGIVVLTDRRVARGALVDVVAGAVGGGVRWVVLREKDLPRAERLALAVELRAILAEAGGTLVVAGPDPLDGDAVHLPAAGPYPPPAVGLVGRSCHDTAELARLTTEHYATLSPVYETRTKPGYGPPLHPDGLRELIAVSPVPVLALGGIETTAQVTACVEAGATGVAVLGAMMRADDPRETATTLGRAFEEAATRVARPHPADTDGGPHATGRRPTVPTEGSSLTARSGHGRPQPQPQPPSAAAFTATTGEDK
ncbi:thiamine phosphate synthase [Micromonospora sp. C32]|uniref:thiamine phosphate synthase n=1 Tax=unclassified Micromonospora TaxID=2617518 RepID=UPI001B38E80C|nr:thiamine phosphate synthase [Micromonospora sp. C32]MBQ1053887.1 thiamine phosphate synthase [Micromonospora sp. C32]